MKQNIDLGTLSQENLTLLLQGLVKQNGDLQAIQLEELQEKRAEKAEERRIQLEAKKQNSIAMDNKHKNDVAAQDYCNHIKANRETHVIGQRDHSNNFHFFCQTCQKHWKNGELPGYLKPNSEWIGGPQL